jgi:hypothetical protein
LFDEPGDEGGHAIDPTASGRQTGYLLSNGQSDTHDDRDTVPLAHAMAIVQHVVDHGCPPDGIAWQDDR